MVERIRTLLEARQLTPTQFADSIGIARPIVSHILSGRNKPSLDVVQRILAAMPDLSMPWLLNGTGPMLAGAPVIPTAQPAPAPEAAAPAQLAAAPPPAPVVAPEAVEAAFVPPAAPINRSRSTELPPKPARHGATGGIASAQEPKRFAPKGGQVSFPAAPEPGSRTKEDVTAGVAAPAAPDGALATTFVQPAVPVATAAQAVPAAIIVATETTVATPTATALLAQTEKPIRRIVIFYHDGSFADYRPE